MDSEKDHVTTSEFLMHMRQIKPQLWKKATSSRLIICVPTRDCYVPRDLEQMTMETYLMRRSPHHVDQLITLNAQTIINKDAALTLKPPPARVRGASAPATPMPVRTVQVLAEENCYDDELRPYQVLWISGCLDIDATPRPVSPPDPLWQPRNTVDEHLAFLKMFPENELPLAAADAQLAAFSSNYAIIRGYLPAARQKLKGVCDMTVDAILAANAFMESANNNDRHYNMLTASVHAYVLDAVNTRLWAAVREVYKQQDSELSAGMVAMREKSFLELGIADYSCDLTDAAATLSSIQFVKLPLEILKLTRSGMNAIADAVGVEAKRHGKPPPPIAADEMLPLFAFAFSISDLPLPRSTIEYACAFVLTDEVLQEWSFVQTTLIAVAQMITSDDVGAGGRVPLPNRKTMASMSMSTAASIPNPIVAANVVSRTGTSPNTVPSTGTSPQQSSTGDRRLSLGSLIHDKLKRRSSKESVSGGGGGPPRQTASAFGPSFGTEDYVEVHSPAAQEHVHGSDAAGNAGDSAGNAGDRKEILQVIGGALPRLLGVKDRYAK